jgi:hypothetical protein
MSIIGKIQSLFSDREKTQPIFPITKTKAVSDDNGVSLDVLLADKASESFVTNKIAEAQLGGGDSGNIDLSGFATKDDIANIDFPVDSVNGKTGVVQLSAADIGAAPAGFGLGGGAVAFAIENIDNMKSNGWFYASSANGYYIGSVPLYYILMRVDSWNDTAGCRRVTQTIDYDGHLIQRVCADGVWLAWEWVNPPMLLGVEYRTTERWDGKAVFTKLLDLGSLPANSTATYSGGLTTATKVHSMELLAFNSDYQYIPLAYESGITSAFFNRGSAQFVIKTNTTYNNIANVYLKVKYSDNR